MSPKSWEAHAARIAREHLLKEAEHLVWRGQGGSEVVSGVARAGVCGIGITPRESGVS